MRELDDYHHFRIDQMANADRVAQCERRVVEMLLTSPLTEEQRESSVTFELKHHHSVGQFARLLARKRDLPVDACTVGALLHDIHVIEQGTYADHAHLGAPRALEIIRDTGGFEAVELDQVHRIVYHHSDKHIWSDDAFEEFGKDADVLDCFLYPGALDFYLRHKSLESFSHYLKRARNVWAELGVPPEGRFLMLDGYADGWFDGRIALQEHLGVEALVGLEDLIAAGDPDVTPPPFAASLTDGGFVWAFNRDLWVAFVDAPSQSGVTLSRGTGAELTRLLMGLLSSIPDVVNESPATFVPAASSTFADLLRGAGPGRWLVVWPAADAYELLDVNDPKAHHLDGLGLRASSAVGS